MKQFLTSLYALATSFVLISVIARMYASLGEDSGASVGTQWVSIIILLPTWLFIAYLIYEKAVKE